MNDIRETLGEDGTGSGGGFAAGARASGPKRCCQPSSRKKRDEMIVLTSAVVCCFVPMLVVAGGSGEKKGAEATAPLVAVAGGGGGSGAAADARDKMEADGSKLVKPSLLFSQRTKIPVMWRLMRNSGSSVSLGTLAVAFDIEPGWHTYWENAGDSGMPPTFEFTVEPLDAVRITPHRWSAPKRHLAEGDILDYIYEGRVLHLFDVDGEVGLETMVPITITCKITWLVCKEACLPGEGEVTTTVKLALEPEKEPETASDKEIAVWAAALPVAESGVFTTKWDKGVLEVAAVKPGRITFFPYAGEGDLVPINLVKGGESKSGVLRLRFDEDEFKTRRSVRGLVRIEGQSAPAEGQPAAYTINIPTPPPPE